jgi:hypothetical protein
MGRSEGELAPGAGSGYAPPPTWPSARAGSDRQTADGYRHVGFTIASTLPSAHPMAKKLNKLKTSEKHENDDNEEHQA